MSSLALRSAEREFGEIDVLQAGGAAAGPTLEDWLDEEDYLWEGQAGRRRFGSNRSRVRNPWAAATIAQWWWNPR